MACWKIDNDLTVLQPEKMYNMEIQLKILRESSSCYLGDIL